MADIHPVAARFGRALRKHQDDPLWPLTKRLIGAKDADFSEPETVRMWSSLAKRVDPSDANCFVGMYLAALHAIVHPPAYLALLAADRRALGKRIAAQAAALANDLRVSGLDSTVIFGAGKLFHGFYFVENFGHSNQARIREAEPTDRNTVTLSRLIDAGAERAAGLLKEAPRRGKAGTNAAAIRVLREIEALHRSWYGAPLNSVVVTVTNRLMGTNYGESDVRNLVQR